ncbi:MAG: cupredoxin domain-containing protein [Nanoarchaeota archaeon]
MKTTKNDNMIFKIISGVLCAALILILINVTSGSGLTKSSSVNNFQEYVIGGNLQIVKMEINAYGYNPSSFVLKKDVPVRWEITVTELTGCNGVIVLPDYNINARLNEGNNVIEFTPNKEGTFGFSCSMGMLRGKFVVTQTGTATQEQINAASQTVTKAPSCGSSGGCGCGG